MIYSKKFKKEQWTKAEVSKLIKNKGKVVDKENIKSILLTLNFLKETSSEEILSMHLGNIIKGYEVRNYLQVIRNTPSFAMWNFCNTMRDMKKSMNESFNSNQQ